MTRTAILSSLVALLIIAITTTVAILSVQSTEHTDQLRVGASLFPVADLVQQVGGEAVDVELILPPGASPHTFEPTPASVRSLANTQTIFTIGHRLDAWTDTLSNSTNTPVVTLDKNVDLLCGEDVHVHEHEEDEHDDHEEEHGDEEAHEEDEHEGELCDPHYWLSTENARGMVTQITETLSDLDPENTATFEANRDRYLQTLTELEAELASAIDEAPSRDLIVFHDSWNYFAMNLGLNIRGTFEASPGREPTAQQLAELQQTVSVYNIGRVYSEPQLSDTVLTAFLSDVDVELGILDPIGGQDNRNSYRELMLFNAHAIQTQTNDRD